MDGCCLVRTCEHLEIVVSPQTSTQVRSNGWSGVGRLARLFPRAVILVYHRVAELAPSPFTVSPGVFAAHMELVATQYQPRTLSDVADAVSSKAVAPGSVVVTFDDGYANNLTAALPSLEMFSVPATLFVATGYTGSDREFWWDELERLVSHVLEDPGRSSVSVSLNGISWTGSAAEPAAASREMKRWLHGREPHEIAMALDQLRRAVGILAPLPPRESHRPMTVD